MRAGPTPPPTCLSVAGFTTRVPRARVLRPLSADGASSRYGDPMTAERYTELVDRALLPHRWIFCSDVGAAYTQAIRDLRAKGLSRPLLLAGSPGTGDLPTEDEAEVVLLGLSADSMMGGIRGFHEALRSLPPEVTARIDAWDPGHEARVMASFLDSDFVIGDRRTWGSRPGAWITLEDKTTVDALWDAAGIARAPSEVVPARRSDLAAASHRVAAGSAVVWAGDNREGWHGGAEYTRFVADPDDAADTVAFLAAHSDRVRVTPFLDGVPCSIHGMVFPATVAVFRPVELVVFRSPGSDRFRYASVATSWDPPPEVRTAMREAARRVGDHLRGAVGYRGVFTMDGVATADGWLPTELNPRFGAGLAPVARASGIPLLGLHRLLVAGDANGMDPAEIEHLAVTAADATRSLSGFVLVPHPIDTTEEVRVSWDGAALRLVGAGEGNATIARGPAATGGMVRFTLDPAAIVPGTQAAPIVAAAFAAIDDLWGTAIGSLIPATPARSAP